MASILDLDHVLVESVKSGQVVLVLGAGASYGAAHPKGESAPLGDKLRNLIVDKFLGPKFNNRSLAEVAELAISQSDLFSVQRYIADIFEPFGPADFHKLLPTFPWAAIATTNYDLVIERAYESQTSRAQSLVPFLSDSDRVEHKLQTPQSIPYLKLHGCITQIDNEKLPLILTTDQYLTHRSGRQCLFNRVEELALNYPLLFVGHKVADPSLRQILLTISKLGDARPRSFLIAPDLTNEEMQMWGARKITCIPGTFESLLGTLDRTIPKITRKLGARIDTQAHPIEKYLRSPANEELLEYLTSSVEIIRPNFPTNSVNALEFYSGHFTDWSPIAHNLDVSRLVTNQLLSDVFFPEEPVASTPQQLYLVKGHAGSGKTVALHRTAWTAGTELDALVLFLRSGKRLDTDLIGQLLDKVTVRVFLFVDRILDYRGEIDQLVRRSRRDRVPLTIVGAAREAHWNQSGSLLDKYITNVSSLGYLFPNEVDELLVKLEFHKALGALAPLSKDARRDALANRAGRQLLVALHEATRGRPFADIVYEEFASIDDATARALYLTVAVLHRIDVRARAGLISRVHGVPIVEFNERLLRPLEHIVYVEKDDRCNDFVYVTRHQHIAEILFERALIDASERRDEYLRLLSYLDSGYSGDVAAIRGLTNAKHLVRLFPSHDDRRSIISAARARFPEEVLLLHQQALLEMNAPEGDLGMATEILRQALRLAPKDAILMHSQAELALRRADASKSDVERSAWRRESRRIAAEVVAAGVHSAHAYHTILKVGLAELEEIVDKNDATALERVIRHLQKTLVEGYERIGQDSYLLDAESRLSEILNNRPKALATLQRAFDQNPKSSYLALRLANQRRHSGDTAAAIAVLKQCLDESPNEKDVHYMLGFLLLAVSDENNLEALGHLRMSYTRGDARYDAQFQCARALFLSKLYGEAQGIFQLLSNCPVPFSRKSVPLHRVRDSKGQRRVFHGRIEALFERNGRVRDESSSQLIFFSSRRVSEADWRDFRRGSRIEYQLAFNYFGPVAVNLFMR